VKAKRESKKCDASALSIATQSETSGSNNLERHGDVHLAVLSDDPLAVAVLILRLSAWKNAMGAMN